MELISTIPVIGGFLASVISFIIVMGVVVFVHEYGHYIVGRWSGIKADVFSLGFGPVVYSRTDKHGTRWQLAAVPLGGYVKFVGDRNAASATDYDAFEGMDSKEKSVSFPGARLHHRALTVAAGPVANLILSVLVFAGLAIYTGFVVPEPTVARLPDYFAASYDVQPGDKVIAVNGQPVTNYSELITEIDAQKVPGAMELTLLRGDDIITRSAPYLLPPLVYGVEPLSPAANGGLKKGDLITAINGEPVTAFSELKAIVENSGGTAVAMTVLRGGDTIEVTVTPLVRDYPDGNGGFAKRVMIGVSGSLGFEPATETPGIGEAFLHGVARMQNMVVMSLTGIRHMITGDISISNLQGPIGIAQISGETASNGVLDLINLIAVISTAVGLLNLFPIPMLDGGHLMFYIVEALRGGPPNEKFVQIAMSIGLAIVLTLMLFASYNDLMRL